MKPRIKLATAQTPDNSEMTLYQHGDDFSIEVNGQDLMHSRQHESELQLARLGCHHISDKDAPSVLIGGLGMGYTLHQALDMLSSNANITVGELIDDVVQWNLKYFGELNSHPLKDERVHLKTGDVVQLISQSKNQFDAILLDIDNGPGAISDSGNSRLYGHEGIQACRRALRKKGTLSVWSAETSKNFEHLLLSYDFKVRRYRVPAYNSSKSSSRFVWVAASDEKLLPKGGGAPRPPVKKTPPKGSFRHRRKRRY